MTSYRVNVKLIKLNVVRKSAYLINLFQIVIEDKTTSELVLNKYSVKSKINGDITKHMSIGECKLFNNGHRIIII